MIQAYVCTPKLNVPPVIAIPFVTRTGLFRKSRCTPDGANLGLFKDESGAYLGCVKRPEFEPGKLLVLCDSNTDGIVKVFRKTIDGVVEV